MEKTHSKHSLLLKKIKQVNVIIRNDLFHNDCHKCNSWTLGRMKYMNNEKWKKALSVTNIMYSNTVTMTTAYQNGEKTFTKIKIHFTFV